MNVLREGDFELGPIRAARIAVIGYGSQGSAQASNLRDSGLDVRVATRANGPSWSRAQADGWDPLATMDAAAWCDVAMLTVPDARMAHVWRDEVAPVLAQGSCLLFAHGFALRYGLVEPGEHIDVGIVAPKGAGAWLRSRFEAGGGLAGLWAVHQDATGHARERVLGYAWGLGCARVGLVETTVAEETETDLFGEQAVLCGGIPLLLKVAFERLVARGYTPEVAYFECVQEAKLIIDLIVERGMSGMRSAISGTAAFGGLLAEERLAHDPLSVGLDELMAAVADGSFARAYLKDDQAGAPRLRALADAEAAHPINAAFRSVRERLPDAF